MPGLFVRLAISALGLLLASEVVTGVRIDGAGTLVAAALLLGLVNAVVRPLLIILTLPITLVTLGLFLLVINAFVLQIVAALLPDFRLDGFGAALLGSIIVSLTSWLASWTIGSRGTIEVGIERRR